MELYLYKDSTYILKYSSLISLLKEEEKGSYKVLKDTLILKRTREDVMYRKYPYYNNMVIINDIGFATEFDTIILWKQ